MPAADVILTLTNQASPQIKQTATDAQALSAALSREALAAGDVNAALRQMDAALGKAAADTKLTTANALASAQAEARLSVTLGDRRGAIEQLETALEGQTARTTAVINAERQLAAIENQGVAAAKKLADAQEKAAEKASVSAQASASFSSSILGMIGPAALVTAGIGAAIGAVQSFGDALTFAGQLQESRAAFDGVYGSIAKGNEVLDSAIARGRAFGFTQDEVTTAYRQLSPIIRESTSSTEDQIGALARFSVLHPEDAVNQLKSAVEGLQSGGRIQALAKDLGLNADEQTKLKKAVKDGTDVFVALNDVLDRHNITLETAATRMDGYAGAARRAQQADEGLEIAEARFAQGPGAVIKQAKTTGIETLTADLSGKGDLAGANQTFISALLRTGDVSAALDARSQALTASIAAESGAVVTNAGAYDANVQAILHHTSALGASKDALDADALKKLDSTIATAQLAAQQAQLDADSQRAAQGMLGAGDQALILAKKYGIATDQAQFLINQQQALSNATALADQRKGEQTGTTNTADAFNKFAKLSNAQAATDAKKTAADAQKLADANDALRLARARTSAQKIAELQRQQAAATDPIEKIKLQTQIEQERNSAAKSHTSELNKQLTIHESIFDSLNKQRDAQLSLIELTIKNRQDTRDEDKKLRTANAILNSSGASADLKGRAQDAIDLINVQRQQRQQKLIEEGATANASISARGKLLQSVPGGGAGAPLPSVPGGGGGGGGGAGPAVPAATNNGGVFTVNLICDGKTLASVSEPYIMDSLMNAIRGGRATIGG